MLSMLGLCARAGKLITGEKACVQAIRSGAACAAVLDGAASGNAVKALSRACESHGVPLLRTVEAENGWLLFFFRTDALDAYAAQLPPAQEPDDSYFARRLWMYARRADAPVPDDAALLQGFFAVLFKLHDGERLFLAAPRQKDGADRISLEQRMTRLAAILLYERRYTL